MNTSEDAPSWDDFPSSWRSGGAPLVLIHVQSRLVMLSVASMSPNGSFIPVLTLESVGPRTLRATFRLARALCRSSYNSERSIRPSIKISQTGQNRTQQRAQGPGLAPLIGCRRPSWPLQGSSCFTFLTPFFFPVRRDASEVRTRQQWEWGTGGPPPPCQLPLSFFLHSAVVLYTRHKRSRRRATGPIVRAFAENNSTVLRS